MKLFKDVKSNLGDININEFATKSELIENWNYSSSYCGKCRIYFNPLIKRNEGFTYCALFLLSGEWYSDDCIVQELDTDGHCFYLKNTRIKFPYKDYNQEFLKMMLKLTDLFLPITFFN